MEKFIIRYTNSQNDTSTETVSEQVNVAEGDDGEPKDETLRRGQSNAYKAKGQKISVQMVRRKIMAQI